MDNLKKKEELWKQLLETIDDAELLIKRCRQAMSDIRTIDEESDDSKWKWFLARNGNIDEGYKHIKIFLVTALKKTYFNKG